jgi:hypothetical protein
VGKPDHRRQRFPVIPHAGAGIRPAAREQHRVDPALVHRSAAGRGLQVVALACRRGHLTRDIGLLAPGTGFQALGPLDDALQSLAFNRRRGTLAFVRAPLSFVCQLLALICDSVPLISDPISFDSEPLALPDLSLTPLEGQLALIERERPAFKLVSHVGMAFNDHSSPQRCEVANRWLRE